MDSTTARPSSASSPSESPSRAALNALALVADLADPARRREAARDAAAALGAEDLLVFTPDPELGTLLPAPGFPQTIPGRGGWQALLDAASAQGQARGAISPPGGGEPVGALALAGRDGSVLVLLNAAAGERDLAWLRALLPLLGGAFRGEREAITAAGQAAVARAAAAQAEALALSLDRVRRELGEALARVRATADENARLYAEVREADRRKTEFLATLAHELRNPLAPIRTGLQVLRLAPAGEPAARAREMMDRQVTHMVRLVDDLLDVSRITSGKIALRRERIDLRAAATAAVETSLPLVEAGRHRLEVQLPDEPLPVDADLTRLAQVFSNLLTNAAKYTPEGGRVRLSAERDGGWVAVRVVDTGVGIPQEMLPRVFDMFTQVGRNLDRAQGGLGIGLTLVRTLAEMHGGTVEARSAGPGQGSEFVVRLPAAADAPPVEVQAPAAHASARGVRVLIVDDNVDAADSLALLLAAHGHVVRAVHTGDEAVAAVDEFRPQLVFLDIGLPGLDGYEAARRIRGGAAGAEAVLVALTGWGGQEDRRRSRAAGFDHHVTKPIEPAEVERLLSRWAPRPE